MHVANILERKGHEVETVSPEASIAEAVEAMRRRGIGSVCVTGADGTLAGILSERDVVEALGDEGGPVLDRRVADLMTREVVGCAPDDDIAELMRVMTRHRIRHLPVLDGGRLAGIISIGDVVKARLDELELEAESLRAYISG